MLWWVGGGWEVWEQEGLGSRKRWLRRAQTRQWGRSARRRHWIGEGKRLGMGMGEQGLNGATQRCGSTKSWCGEVGSSLRMERESWTSRWELAQVASHGRIGQGINIIVPLKGKRGCARSPSRGCQSPHSNRFSPAFLNPNFPQRRDTETALWLVWASAQF